MPFTLGGDWAERPKKKKQLKVFTEKRKGQTLTIVKNYDGDLKAMAKALKQHLSCGGTIKNEQIELQGDHVQKVSSYFESLTDVTRKV